MKEEATIADFEIWKDQPNSLEKVATIECNLLLLHGPVRVLGMGVDNIFLLRCQGPMRERESPSFCMELTSFRAQEASQRIDGAFDLA